MLRELRTPEGGFAASLDADSDGEEGGTTSGRPAELREVLGEEDGAFAAQVFGVTRGGHLRARHLRPAAAARSPPDARSGSTGSAARC